LCLSVTEESHGGAAFGRDIAAGVAALLVVTAACC